jgi:hypothetical protein
MAGNTPPATTQPGPFRPACIMCVSDCDANGCFTNCQHFLCVRCFTKYPKGACPRCQKPCQVIRLGAPNFPKDVMERITIQPLRLLQQTAVAMEFQKRQEALMTQRLKELVTNFNNSHRQCMEQLARANTQVRALESENLQLKAEVSRLQLQVSQQPPGSQGFSLHAQSPQRDSFRPSSSQSGAGGAAHLSFSSLGQGNDSGNALLPSQGDWLMSGMTVNAAAVPSQSQGHLMSLGLGKRGREEEPTGFETQAIHQQSRMYSQSQARQPSQQNPNPSSNFLHATFPTMYADAPRQGNPDQRQLTPKERNHQLQGPMPNQSYTPSQHVPGGRGGEGSIARSPNQSFMDPAREDRFRLATPAMTLSGPAIASMAPGSAGGPQQSLTGFSLLPISGPYTSNPIGLSESGHRFSGKDQSSPSNPGQRQSGGSRGLTSLSVSRSVARPNPSSNGLGHLDSLLPIGLGGGAAKIVHQPTVP